MWRLLINPGYHLASKFGFLLLPDRKTATLVVYTTVFFITIPIILFIIVCKSRYFIRKWARKWAHIPFLFPQTNQLKFIYCWFYREWYYHSSCDRICGLRRRILDRIGIGLDKIRTYLILCRVDGRAPLYVMLHSCNTQNTFDSFWLNSWMCLSCCFNLLLWNQTL